MPSERPVPPGSFHYEYSDDWAIWVLDNGLPGLPDLLGEDDEVPIAYWAGRAVGAVLFRGWSGEVDQTTGQRDVDTDHYSYVRTKAGWEPTGGGGGTGGPEDDPMQPRPWPDRLAVFTGGWEEGGSAGAVRGVTGHVGAAARTIELTDRHGQTRRPVDAPLGWVIVCFDRRDEVTIRVLDADDHVLAETQRIPGRH